VDERTGVREINLREHLDPGELILVGRAVGVTDIAGVDLVEGFTEQITILKDGKVEEVEDVMESVGVAV